ncbi:hypothetical protein B7P43_G13255 [Cryptotermes secundus]|uniref:Uncharacterized protein n=1 Tax=Cryptotermes secundus TaxID=105785 RepID=A0A2J7QDB8_9NEOP|nr:hypothetical protein B7P43_G13255 [Cryptotermes secundus]
MDIHYHESKAFHDFSPQANDTDRAIATCWRSLVPTSVDRRCHVVSTTNPHVHPIADQLLLRKIR